MAYIEHSDQISTEPTEGDIVQVVELALQGRSSAAGADGGDCAAASAGEGKA